MLPVAPQSAQSQIDAANQRAADAEKHAQDIETRAREAAAEVAVHYHGLTLQQVACANALADARINLAQDED